MKKEQKKEGFKLSYESDETMGKKEQIKDADVEPLDFFNTTQSSE